MISYELVDIGANLAHPNFRKDFDQVVERAKQAGLTKIMITGTCLKSTKEARDLCAKYPGFFYFTSGVHPHDAKTWTEDVRKAIVELAAHPACVAIGECGLDFNRNFSPQDQQRAAFEEQVKIACELKKSLFIHERDAHDDLLEILERHSDRLPPAVVHCFTGSAAQAKTYLDKGFYLGLTGFLWKDRSEDGVRFALKNGMIPLDRLLLETDAPFMYCKVNDKKIPAEIREKISSEAKELHSHCSFNRNEPCGLAASCELIAAFANVDAAELAKRTTENAKKIYGLE
ncbi:Hydrolase, TatD family [Aphelenchoides fujianensis]|nr:Hydrolase, TatD family [Aphelenchoides fujianensis]